MRKNGKGKLVLTLLALAVAIAFVPQVKVLADSEPEGIAINSENFSDPTFMRYVQAKFDKDGNERLSEEELSEAKVITYLDIGDYIDDEIIENIADFKGLEYFTSLEELSTFGELDSLDLSANTALVSLGVYDAKLSSLDLKANTKLETLCLQGNDLKSLDLTPNSKLTRLECTNDNLESIDVSKCTDLVTFFCNVNKLTTLDVSCNTALDTLSCSDNNLSKLDLSQCADLTALHCENNKLTELDVSKNEYLGQLTCHGNSLKTLDIRNCPNLSETFLTGDDVLEYEETIAYRTEFDFIYFYLEVDRGVEVIAEDPEPTATPSPSPSATPTATPTATATPMPKVTIKLNRTKDSVVAGKSITLKTTIGGTKEKAKWTTSNKNIATVTSSGKVTCKSAGSVVITATVAGKKATCKIQVLYKDVTAKSDFWFTPTNELTNRGIVKGYDNQTRFKPGNDCTRAQMVTFLWRLKGEPKPSSSAKNFKDVKKDAYYYKAVLWAAGKKITTGYKDGTFKPNGVCTRAQTVTFLWRMAGSPKPGTSKNPFKDVKNSDYFYKAVLWASNKKIVAGYSNGTFKPQDKCLRRQMVTFLYKFDKNVK